MREKESEKMIFKLRVQNIYFQKLDNGLGIFRINPEKKISLSEAVKILEDHYIEFYDVLKVKIEYVTIETDPKELEKMIIK